MATTTKRAAVTAESVERLSEIKDEIKELLREAMELLPGGMIEQRARAYWYPHVAMALDDDHEYMGRSMGSMQDTIDEMETQMEADEDAEDADL